MSTFANVFVILFYFFKPLSGRGGTFHSSSSCCPGRRGAWSRGGRLGHRLRHFNGQLGRDNCFSCHGWICLWDFLTLAVHTDLKSGERKWWAKKFFVSFSSLQVQTRLHNIYRSSKSQNIPSFGFTAKRSDKSSDLHFSNTHHNSHGFPSVFVLNNHGIFAWILHGNASDCKTGKLALVQRDLILKHGNKCWQCQLEIFILHLKKTPNKTIKLNWISGGIHT